MKYFDDLIRNRNFMKPIHDMRITETKGPPTQRRPDLSSVMDVSRHVIMCPTHIGPKLETMHALRGLEELGFRVNYLKGASAIDLIRCLMASEVVANDFESVLFVDDDMAFQPQDAVKLLLSDEPVIAGAYAAKALGKGKINADFVPGTKTVEFGEHVMEPYPIRTVGAGFLRIKISALRTMIDALELPYVRMGNTYGWPFFMPLVAEQDGELRYLTEDYAFCFRCHQAGIVPKLDTSFRLYHLGDYGYGIEEGTGTYILRQKTLTVDLTAPETSEAGGMMRLT